KGLRLPGDAFRVQAHQPVQPSVVSVLDELVGNTDAMHPYVVEIRRGEPLQHRRTETARDHPALDGHEAPGAPRPLLQQLRVEGLGEARVDDRGADALAA